MLVIDQQVTYKTLQKTKDKKYLEKRPKSKNSFREVLMPSHVIDRIAPLVKSNSPGFVFGGAKPLTPSNLARKFDHYINLANKKLIQDGKSSLPRITPHDLRHSHVSFIINKTKDGDLTKLYAIADRIGDTVDQVLKTYGHLFKSAQNTLINEIERVISTD